MSEEQKSPQPADKEALYNAFEEPVRHEEKKKGKTGIHARIRTLMIALGAAVILAVLLLVVSLLPKKNDSVSSGDPSEENTVTVFDRTGLTVTGVRIKAGESDYTLSNENKTGDWTLQGYEDLTVSQNAGALAEKCVTLTATSKVKEADDLSAFGLDKPSATVTATYSDSSQHSWSLGKMTPSEEGYYCQTADSKEVYIIDTDTAAYFLSEDWWYVSTALIAPPSTEEDAENDVALLRSLSLSGKIHPDNLTIRRVNSDDAKQYSYFKYVTTKPYFRGVMSDVGDSLYAVSSLTADRAYILHPTQEQLTKYGFRDPYTVAKLTLAVERSTDNEDTTKHTYYNNCDHVITVGGLTDDTAYYFIMVDDINAIYLMSTEGLQKIVERQYDNTVSSSLFLQDITEISRLKLELKGEKHEFELKHYPDKTETDDQLAVSEGTHVFKTADFRKLYVLMMDLQRYEVLDKVPTGEPELTIALYDPEGNLYLSADFYPAGSSLYNVKTSEGECFTTRASNVTRLITQFDNFLHDRAVAGT